MLMLQMCLVAFYYPFLTVLSQEVCYTENNFPPPSQEVNAWNYSDYETSWNDLLLAFCTQFNVQQTELSAASQKYWCFYNLRKKTKTTEFNWLADAETSHEGQLLLSFTLLPQFLLNLLLYPVVGDNLGIIYSIHTDMLFANERGKWKLCVEKLVYFKMKLYCHFSQVPIPENGLYQNKQERNWS